MRADQARDLHLRLEMDSAPGYSVAFHHRFEAHPQSVRAALRATLDRLGCQISGEEAGALELVLAEVFNNIVEHGYADCGEGVIVLSIYPEENALLCTVGDAGSALPRRCIETVEAARPRPEDLPEGGFGWFLIHDLVRDLHYEREDDHNLLVFRLPLNSGAKR